MSLYEEYISCYGCGEPVADIYALDDEDNMYCSLACMEAHTDEEAH